MSKPRDIFSEYFRAFVAMALVWVILPVVIAFSALALVVYVLTKVLV